MPTIFTRIIDGEIPGTFVHRDEHCVAFLDINPATRGHTQVIPRNHSDDLHAIGREDLISEAGLDAAGIRAAVVKRWPHLAQATASTVRSA